MQSPKHYPDGAFNEAIFLWLWCGRWRLSFIAVLADKIIYNRLNVLLWGVLSSHLLHDSVKLLSAIWGEHFSSLRHTLILRIQCLLLVHSGSGYQDSYEEGQSAYTGRHWLGE